MKLEVLMKKAILIIFALLLACSDISHAAQDRYILRFGTTLTPGNAIFNAVEHFTKAVNEKTQGRATVQLFHSGQLGSDQILLEQVISGALDFACSSQVNLAAFTDAFMWTSFPCLFKSPESAQKVIQSSIGDEMWARLESLGDLKVVHWLDYRNNRMVCSQKEVRVPDDMAGLKIRATSSPIDIALLKAYGAAPTPVAWGELYMALEQGVVNGMLGDWMYMESAKHYEVLNYCLESGVGVGGYVFQVMVTNKRKFESFPEDIQKAIMEAGEEAYEKLVREAKTANDSYRERYIREGLLKVTQSTPEEDALWLEKARLVWRDNAKYLPDELLNDVLEMQEE